MRTRPRPRGLRRKWPVWNWNPGEDRPGEETEARLSAEIEARVAELAKCVELLHAAEKTIDERTEWVHNLEKEIAALEEASLRRKAPSGFRLGVLWA